MNLPPAIQTYFDADKSSDREALLRAFAPDAVVVDEGQSHAGHAAIDAWWRNVKTKFEHVLEPLEISETDGAAKVRVKVTGQFPGSPVLLTFAIRLSGGQITRLDIRA